MLQLFGGRAESLPGRAAGRRSVEAVTAAAAARFRPTRSRGRNLLLDREVAARFAAALLDSPAVGGDASASPRAPEGSTDARNRPGLVEIGPGRGAFGCSRCSPPEHGCSRSKWRPPGSSASSRSGRRSPAGGAAMTATEAAVGDRVPTRPFPEPELPARRGGRGAVGALDGTVVGVPAFVSCAKAPAVAAIGPGKGAFALPLPAARGAGRRGRDGRPASPRSSGSGRRSPPGAGDDRDRDGRRCPVLPRPFPRAELRPRRGSRGAVRVGAARWGGRRRPGVRVVREGPGGGGDRTGKGRSLAPAARCPGQWAWPSRWRPASPRSSGSGRRSPPGAGDDRTGAAAGARFFLTRFQGRNFVRDREVAARFAAAVLERAPAAARSTLPPSNREAAETSDAPAVVEIGPGTGVLTLPRLDAGARVLAVEVEEPWLAGILRARAALSAGGRG